MATIVLATMVLASGCAGRSIQSRGHSEFGTHASGEPGIPDSDSAMAGRVQSHDSQGDPSIDDDVRGERRGRTTGFESMDEETVGDNSPIAESAGGAPGRDYWEERRRAELVAAEHGVKDVHFAFDSWRLTNEAKRILAVNAEWLKTHPNARVTIEGHCDERGTRAYNYILGEKRAIITRNYLAALGVPPRQMMIQSYGKDHPVCREDSEACYAKNRRAHFLVGFTIAATAR